MAGKIQYVKYPIDYNMQAFKTLLKRAMRLGFYEGVNLSLPIAMIVAMKN